MIESVLFDLDGTILDREKSLEKFIELQYQNLVAHQYDIDFNQYKNRFWSVNIILDSFYRIFLYILLVLDHSMHRAV